MAFDGMPELESIYTLEYSDLEFGPKIGQGAFGNVYRGSYFGVDVAIKQMQKGEKNDAELKKYVEREISMLKFSHPLLVQFVGLCYEGDHVYLVTEFVPGGNLRQHLKKTDVTIPWKLRLQIASNVASSMAFLHSKKIIHRDLKSKNLLVDINWKIKVCDFGFARSFAFEPGTNRRQMSICGTEDWMAPEVMLGMDYNEKADVFSYGIVLCEIITRKKVGKELQRYARDAFCLNIDQFRALAPADCPPALIRLTIACCEYEQDQRPSFKDILQVLKEIDHNLPASNELVPSPVPGHGPPTTPLPAPPTGSGAVPSSSNLSTQQSAVKASLRKPSPRGKEQPTSPRTAPSAIGSLASEVANRSPRLDENSPSNSSPSTTSPSPSPSSVTTANRPRPVPATPSTVSTISVPSTPAASGVRPAGSPRGPPSYAAPVPTGSSTVGSRPGLSTSTGSAYGGNKQLSAGNVTSSVVKAPPGVPSERELRSKISQLGSVSQPGTLCMDNLAQLQETIRTVLEPSSYSGWILLGYKDPRTLTIQEVGVSSSISELRSKLNDSEVQYMLLRLPSTNPNERRTTRDIFIAWTGPKVSILQKGKKKTHIGEVKEFLKPFHAELSAIDRTNFTDNVIWERSGPLSGSHIID